MNSKPIRLSIIGVCALVGVALHSSASAQCDPIETQKILAADGRALGDFGVAIAIEGDTALIGTEGSDYGTNSGSAYVFQRVGDVWHQVVKLVPSDIAPVDFYGCSVSISGTIAIVGALNDDDLGYNSGSAYLFEKASGVWTQVAKLHASDGAELDYFGQSVSVSGDVAFVGAPSDDDRGRNSGSVYVFEKLGGIWMQTAKLVASDGVADGWFGQSVSISGDSAIVGAWGDRGRRGSAYVFEVIGGTWTQVAKLSPPDVAADAYLGWSVSLSGHTAIVGALGDDDRGLYSGSAYVFERVGGVWTQVAKLLASDGAGDDNFGNSVSVSAGTAVVGAWYGDGSAHDSGSAYAFKPVDGVWTEVAKLTAADGATGDWFGLAVAISGNTACVGAPYDDDLGDHSGSAYVYDLNCGPQLSVNATCPSGGPIQVSWSGATGGGTVVLLYARNTGSFRIPNGNPCAGTQLGLGSNQLQIGYQGAAGSNGSRTLNSNTGAGICGGYLQLLDVATCGTSNVVRVE